MTQRRAFTLIELLVVVSIIGLLVGITMPSVSEARRLAKKTVCKKSLGQLGTAVHAYLLANRDTFPRLARMPSFEEEVAAQENRKTYPPMMLGLARELGMARGEQSRAPDGQFKVIPENEVFRCPADQNTKTPEVATDRYYDKEKTSYEWESQLNGLRLDFKGVRVFANTPLAKIIRPQDMWMMFDFEAYHGGDKVRGSFNVLYADLRVQSDNWKSDKTVGKGM